MDSTSSSPSNKFRVSPNPPPPPPPSFPPPPLKYPPTPPLSRVMMSPWMNASRRLPPLVRRWYENATSEHMFPTDNTSPNRHIFTSRHRLVQRNLPFFQSKNEIQVSNQHMEFRLWTLLSRDWFHVFLRMNLALSLGFLLGTWSLAIVLFAWIYMRIDRIDYGANCGLGPVGNPIGFGPAFAFSLETCTTVGYSLPNGVNAFFESNCPQVQVAIYFQMVWSMMFNAFLFAFFFARLAKCESRGVQVIFSDKAIIGNRPDVPYPCFFFRLFDADARYPVVEAHVRLYVVSQRSPVPMPLRTLIPNDELGGMLFMSLPCSIVHTMDMYSPLMPRSKIKCPASATVPPFGLNLRQADSVTNNRDDVNCPVCGESYGSIERLIQHGKFNKMTETHDKIPYQGSHREVNWAEWEEMLKQSTTWTIPQIQAYFRSAISEIICVVEGIDPLASGTFQAIHSYQFEDIHFGQAHFADCVCLDEYNNCVVDLDFFHKVKSDEASDDDDDDETESDNDPSGSSPDTGSLKLPPFPGARRQSLPKWPPSPQHSQQLIPPRSSLHQQQPQQQQQQPSSENPTGHRRSRSVSFSQTEPLKPPAPDYGSMF